MHDRAVIIARRATEACPRVDRLQETSCKVPEPATVAAWNQPYQLVDSTDGYLHNHNTNTNLGSHRPVEAPHHIAVLAHMRLYSHTRSHRRLPPSLDSHQDVGCHSETPDYPPRTAYNCQPEPCLMSRPRHTSHRPCTTRTHPGLLCDRH